MNDTKKNPILLFVSSFIAILSLLTAPAAQAGAWTQEKGSLQLITTAAYYRAGSRFDNEGHKVPQPAYTKRELNPYVEYGLTDSLTAGCSLFFQDIDDSGGHTSGVGDSEIFLRQRLLSTQRFVLSLQPELKLPSPMASNRESPAIGSKHVDPGLRIAGGMNFRLFGQEHFVEAQAAYRHRPGAPDDQLRFSASAGLRINEHLTMLPQLSQTARFGKPPVSSGMFTQSPRDDYNLTVAQLSAVYRLDEKRAVQLGVFKHVAGMNTGNGGGVLLSYWLDY